MSISKMFVLILSIIAAFSFGDGSASASNPPLSERVLGKEDAPVTIIEYASLTCDHCKRFHLEILPRLKEAYIDTGNSGLPTSQHSGLIPLGRWRAIA